MEHYYHAYADGNWAVAVAEHLHAIADIPFTRKFIGVVGTPANRAELLQHFPPPGRPWTQRQDGWELVAEAATGAEELTLDCIQRRTQDHDAAVLYCHTKGASSSNPFNGLWRRRMTASVVDWQRCTGLLATYDAAGPFWLTPQEHGRRIGDTPYFAGNFWWARAAYLRQLPQIPPGTARHWAEGWVGRSVACNAYNLLPGWPM